MFSFKLPLQRKYFETNSYSRIRISKALSSSFRLDNWILAFKVKNPRSRGQKSQKGKVQNRTRAMGKILTAINAFYTLKAVSVPLFVLSHVCFVCVCIWKLIKINCGLKSRMQSNEQRRKCLNVDLKSLRHWKMSRRIALIRNTMKFSFNFYLFFFFLLHVFLFGIRWAHLCLPYSSALLFRFYCTV